MSEVGHSASPGSLASSKRRLPVLTSRNDPESFDYPRWLWLLVGAGVTFSLWVPLGIAALFSARRLANLLSLALGSPGDRVISLVAVLAPLLLSFFLSSFGGGALVGRFAARSGILQGAWAGALGAFVAWGLAAVRGGLHPWPVAFSSLVVLLLVGGGSAALGARIGLRRRARAESSAQSDRPWVDPSGSSH